MLHMLSLTKQTSNGRANNNKINPEKKEDDLE